MLKFDGREITALCIMLDRDKTINAIQNMRRARSKNISTVTLIKMHNRLLLHSVRNRIAEFLSQHGHELSSTAFQCDSDWVNFLKDDCLHRTSAGDVHMLSCIVAWANNRNREPEGVISVNPAAMIRRKLKEKILA